MKNKKITYISVLHYIHLYDSCVRGIRKMWYVNASRKHLCFLRSFLSVRKKWKGIPNAKKYAYIGTH